MVVADNNEDDDEDDDEDEDEGDDEDDDDDDNDEDGVGILQAHVCNDLIRALPPRGRGCSSSQ